MGVKEEREFNIISYFISFLRGNIPGGPFLLLLLLVVFTFILWYVVRTSGLLERGKARRIMKQGWAILIGAYIVVWLLTKPEASPRTVLVVPFIDQTTEGWLGEALADEVGETLVRNSYNLFRLPWDVCPAFQHDITPDSVWETIKRIKPTYAIWGTVRGNKDSLSIKTYYARTRWGRAVRFSENTTRYNSLFQASANISELAFLNILIPKKTETNYAVKEHRFSAISNLYSSKKKFREGKIEEALSYAVQAVAEDSSWDDSWRMIGQCWDLMDDPSARGISALRKAIQLDSADVRNWRCLARYSIRRQQWNYAEDALRIAYRLKRRNPVTLFLLSHLHPDRLKQFNNLTAEKALEKAVEIYPGYEDARVKYAWLLYNRRDFQDCEHLAQDGLQLNNDSWELLELLAMSHIHLGKRQFAIKEIQQSLVLSDDNPAVLYNAGYIFMTIDSLDLAKEYLLKSVKAHGNSDGYYLLGLCAEQQGDTTDALHYYQLSSAASTGENDKSAREAAKKVTILIQE